MSYYDYSRRWLGVSARYSTPTKDDALADLLKVTSAPANVVVGLVTPIKRYVPRIYLDTNILISAILESDKQWKSRHPKDFHIKKNEIESSRKIFQEYEHRAGQLKTSTFAVGEFIGKGGKQFGKSFQEMLGIVDREILTKFELCETGNLRYDRQTIPGKMQKEIRLMEIIGKAQVGTEFRFMVLLDMSIGRVITGGLPDVGRVDLEDMVFREVESYKAPGYEIMLFQKASELANKYQLSLADALHLFYAQGKVEYLITNDSEFLHRWSKDPTIKKETKISAIGSAEFLELCKKRRYLS